METLRIICRETASVEVRELGLLELHNSGAEISFKLEITYHEALAESQVSLPGGSGIWRLLWEYSRLGMVASSDLHSFLNPSDRRVRRYHNVGDVAES